MLSQSADRQPQEKILSDPHFPIPWAEAAQTAFEPERGDSIRVSTALPKSHSAEMRQEIETALARAG